MSLRDYLTTLYYYYVHLTTILTGFLNIFSHTYGQILYFASFLIQFRLQKIQFNV